MSDPLLVLVDDGVPEETLESLAGAVGDREVDLEIVDAPTFDFRQPPLAPGTMLYTPAASMAAARVEQALFQPGVVTFHRHAGGPHLLPLADDLRLQRAGIPIPRSFWVQSDDRDLIAGYVEALGGYPVVLKVPGGSGGVGVMRADSAEALHALVEFLLSRGEDLQLRAFVDATTVHRIIVVGDRAVAAYENPTDEADFRSAASEEPTDYTDSPAPELGTLAVETARIVGVELGGVDIIEHRSGRPYVLECNFPLYFGHAQLDGGIDVAGAMVDHLLAKRAGR